MKKTKTCSKCGKTFPDTREYFYMDKGKLRSDCKECRKKQRKEYATANKDKIKEYEKTRRVKDEKYYEYHKQYREQNKEKASGYRKQYYKDNKEKFHELHKKWCEQNKEKALEHRKRHYENNKEKVSERSAKWYEENKEKILKRHRKYDKDHPEQAKMRYKRRKMKKLQLPATLTTKQWTQIKEYFDNKCCYCGKDLPLEQEHFIPITKGGEYTVNNIIPACRSCNASKNNKDFFKWYLKYRYYSKKRERKILDFLGYKEDKQQLSLII